jgi:hypothetical protein
MGVTDRLVPLVRLRNEVGWSIDADRIYIARPPQLEEIGLPMHGMPPALVRLLFHQLRIGTTNSDLIFLYGRIFFRKVRKVLQELRGRSLMETDGLRLTIAAGNELVFKAPETGTPMHITVPDQPRLLIQAGPLAQFSLPATLIRKADWATVIFDIGVAGGHLVLAHTRGSRSCLSCLALWFFGSRVLPLSFLSASLNEPERRALGCAPMDRIQIAHQYLKPGESSILYFPRTANGKVVLDVPPGRHPACRCMQQWTLHA